MPSREVTIAAVAGATVIGGLLAYAAYFDYKRRNDGDFRRKLRKEKKKVEKTKTEVSASQSASVAVDADELRAALERVKNEDVPTNPSEREQYFMGQVGMGEQLAAQGPMFHLPAALHFYRALRVYPAPVELIVIYEKTVPPPVFKLVMEMTNMDVEERIHGYYKVFPPQSMNVSVKQVNSVDADGSEIKKKVVVLTKDVKAGDVIYQEQPMVAALDADLEGKGTHCTYCLRKVKSGMALTTEDDRLGAAYCSKDCQVKSKAQSENLLFTAEPVITNPEVPMPPMPESTAERVAAQEALVKLLNGDSDKRAPMLLARFVARQIAIETAKLPGAGADSGKPYMADIPDTGSSEYSIYDHVERLRFVTVDVTEGEKEILKEALRLALPGLEGIVDDERYATLKGKMQYNAIGVCLPAEESALASDASSLAGRDDRPASSDRPEDLERTRTPQGTARQVGCGFYPVSAYIQHSCDPSARPSFRAGTAELHLVANRDMKSGDELTIAFVDVSQRAEETAADARRRRRIEIARGWRFACTCEKCIADGAPPLTEVPVQKDESKLEAAAERHGI